MTILPDQPTGRSRRVPLGSRSVPWLVALALVLIAVAATGVVIATRGGSDDVSPAAAPTTPPSTAAPSSAVTPPRRWRVAIRAVSQPAPVAGRFVVYAVTHGRLELVAIDATSGRIAWTNPASPSAIAPGSAPKLAVIGDRIVYPESLSGNVASLTAVNATTGAVAWHSPPGVFSGWPEICADDASAVCISGQVQNNPDAGILRFNASTGQALPSPQLGPAARELAQNLFDVGERHPESIVATNGDAGIWREPLQRIFTQRGSSTDYGWNFDRFPHLGLYIGSVGTPPFVQTKTRYADELSNSMTAAFRMSDGAPMWRDAGSQYICGYLACPGQLNRAYSSVADVDTDGPTVGVRLLARGVISGSPTAIKPRISRDARGVLEGFDPATGHVRWTFNAGRDIGLITQTRLPPQESNNAIVLRTPSGHLIELNIVTGEKRLISSHASAWCSKVITYRMAVAYRAGGHVLHHYVGQYALDPCTAAGQPTAAPKQGTGALHGLMAESNHELAWTEQGAVIGVPD